ncbi:MAG TPA: hypothetical protein VNN73_09610 [Blastocatellia bacterium]|nr:hypothetical protein [Blastocatellia bacterium]
MKIGKKEILTTISGLSAAGLGAYALFLRPKHLHWGATRDEIKEELPGDEVVPHPKHEATHAITIKAPIATVWPWLVQMGQTRGGFYSYTWLENLVGCDMHNADRIVPEWQELRVGDVVWLHPKAPPLPVIIIEPYHAIVLGGQSEQGTNGAGTWGFYLKRLDEQTTRLIIRIRWDRRRGLMNWLGNYALLEPAHFVMERKMMLGIKERAEKAFIGDGQVLKV